MLHNPYGHILDELDDGTDEGDGGGKCDTGVAEEEGHGERW